MPSLPTAKEWSVLIVCTGHGKELLHDVVRKEVDRLGLRATVYDHPGYPVDPSLHSHAACVAAIQSHDIVLALLDESEGGVFQVSQARPKWWKTCEGASIAACWIATSASDNPPG